LFHFSSRRQEFVVSSAEPTMTWKRSSARRVDAEKKTMPKEEEGEVDGIMRDEDFKADDDDDDGHDDMYVRKFGPFKVGNFLSPSSKSNKEIVATMTTTTTMTTTSANSKMDNQAEKKDNSSSKDTESLDDSSPVPPLMEEEPDVDPTSSRSHSDGHLLTLKKKENPLSSLDALNASLDSPTTQEEEDEKNRRMVHKQTAEGHFLINSKPFKTAASAGLVYNLEKKDRAMSSKAILKRAASFEDKDEKKTTTTMTNSPTPQANYFKVFVLLILPKSKIFELIQVMYSPVTTTVGDLLQMIPENATEPALGQATYLGFCRPKDGHELNQMNILASNDQSEKEGEGQDKKEGDDDDDDNKKNESSSTSSSSLAPGCANILQGEILVAIPKGFDGPTCARLTQPILSNRKLMKLMEHSDPLATPRRFRKKTKRRKKRHIAKTTKEEGEETTAKEEEESSSSPQQQSILQLSKSDDTDSTFESFEAMDDSASEQAAAAAALDLTTTFPAAIVAAAAAAAQTPLRNNAATNTKMTPRDIFQTPNEEVPLKEEEPLKEKEDPPHVVKDSNHHYTDNDSHAGGASFASLESLDSAYTFSTTHSQSSLLQQQHSQKRIPRRKRRSSFQAATSFKKNKKRLSSPSTSEIFPITFASLLGMILIVVYKMDATKKVPSPNEALASHGLIMTILWFVLLTSLQWKWKKQQKQTKTKRAIRQALSSTRKVTAASSISQ